MADLSPEAADARHLSRMLFDARENLEMWADVVSKMSGQDDLAIRRLIEEIDTYRVQRGWLPYGFGGESG